MKSLPVHELKKHIKEIYDNPEIGILNLNKKLKANKKIIKFDLSDMLSKVGGDDKTELLINIARALSGTSVTHFSIGKLKYVSESSFDFVKEFKSTVISSFYFCNSSVEPEAAEELSKNIIGTKLKSIYFYKNNLGDDGIIFFGQHLANSDVMEVHLSHNNVSDIGITEFSQYIKGSKLTALYFGSNKIYAQGATELGKSLPGSLVTIVDLGGNGLGNEGAIGFTASLKGSLVSRIDLSRNGIGDNGALGLLQNLIGTEVTSVNLSNNKITSQSVKSIVELIKLTNLTSADFGYNQLTVQDLALIERALQGNTQLNPLARAYLPNQKPPITLYAYFLALPLKIKIGLVAGFSLLLGGATYALSLMAATVSSELSVVAFTSLGGLAAAVGYWRKTILAYVNDKYIQTDKQKHKAEIETVKAQVLPYAQQLSANKSKNLITEFAQMLAKTPNRAFDAHGAAVPNNNLSFTRLEALRFQRQELSDLAAVSPSQQGQFEEKIIKRAKDRCL